MSKRASYTPGPWTLHEYEDDGVRLADVFDRNLECKTACLNIGDARLIAAAPDLLEVAKTALLYANSKGNDLLSNMAERAIAKATGADHEQAV